MRKYLLCITILLTLINVCLAQINKTELEQAKNFLNNRVTFLMLREYVKTEIKSQQNFDAIKPLFEDTNVEKAVDYSKLQETLKGKFDKAVEKLSGPINNININEFTDLSKEDAAKRLTDSVFFILSSGYGDKFKSLESNKQFLISAIVQYIGQKQQLLAKDSQDARQNENIVDVRKELPTNVKEAGFFSFKNFSFWTLLPLLFCLGIVIIFLRVILRLEQRIGRRKEEIEKLSDTQYLQSNSRINTRDVEKMVINSDTIQMLSQDIADLKKRIGNIKPGNSPYAKTYHEPLQQDAPGEIFYMAGPVNNYFPNTAKSLTKENTVYKFTLKGNKREATYEIHTSGAPLNEILGIVESYIKPACDEENLPGINVKNIITKKHGTASLEGDKWVIKTKAIIKYE
jgi:hypothetical protein